MTRGADNVWNRLGAATLTALFVAVAGFALVDAPALAADPSPTLSVHVTEGTTGDGASNAGGVQLPQDQEPESAGAGFIYESRTVTVTSPLPATGQAIVNRERG